MLKPVQASSHLCPLKSALPAVAQPGQGQCMCRVCILAAAQEPFHSTVKLRICARHCEGQTNAVSGHEQNICFGNTCCAQLLQHLNGLQCLQSAMPLLLEPSCNVFGSLHACSDSKPLLAETSSIASRSKHPWARSSLTCAAALDMRLAKLRCAPAGAAQCVEIEQCACMPQGNLLTRSHASCHACCVCACDAQDHSFMAKQ